MKVDFHQIKGSEEIRVIVQASDRTQEVEDLMEAIRSLSPSPWTVIPRERSPS